MTENQEENNEHGAVDSRQAEILVKIKALLDGLPAVPPTIMELRMAVSDPSTDYARLVPILEKDAELCSDLLRFANSAYYGVEHKVESVSEAVRYFGMSNLVELVAASFCERVIRKSFADLTDLGSYYKHARLVSRGCAYLTKSMKMGRLEREIYIMTGLLHDIGRPMINLAANHTSAPLGGSTWDQFDHVTAEEQELAGIDHCSVGADICSKWEFPKQVYMGIFRHHSPITGDTMLSASGAIIYLAHYVAMPGLPAGRLKTALPRWALDRMNLSLALLYDTRVACQADLEIPEDDA